MAPEAVKAASSKWPPACGFAPVGRYPSSRLSFAQLSLFITAGHPGPRHNIDKELRALPPRRLCIAGALRPKRRATPTNFADIRSRARTPPRARALVPRETYNYREFSPVISVGALSSLSAEKVPCLGAKRKGRFSFSVCYPPCNLLRVTTLHALCFRARQFVT